MALQRDKCIQDEVDNKRRLTCLADRVSPCTSDEENISDEEVFMLHNHTISCLPGICLHYISICVLLLLQGNNGKQYAPGAIHLLRMWKFPES